MTWLLLPATLLSTITLVQGLPNLRRQKNAIEWKDCEYPWESTFPVQCAKLAVPLDHTGQVSDASIDLDLVRVEAINEPVLGTMLSNPGGPGASGVSDLVSSAEDYLLLTGGQYNLVSFDPRGTGRTMPYNCTIDEATSRLVKRNGTVYSESLALEVDKSWEGFLETAAACEAVHENDGQFFGTVSVVRDMVEILDALDGDGLLRYYGSSYGTLLGFTFAAMFPLRVERMILDGVVNPVEYWAGADIEWTTDADDLLMNFFTDCAAAPELCILAEFGDADDILQELNDVLKELAKEPWVSPEDAEVTYTHIDLKNAISQGIYAPFNNEDLAATIHLAILRDFAAILTPANSTEDTSEDSPPPWDLAGEDALSGITCSDQPLRVKSSAELATYIARQEAMSSFGDVFNAPLWGCVVWPFDAVERYEFSDISMSVKTKFPVLFVNPTWDPVTPLVSARNASTMLEGSVVLEHKGNGHCTGAQKSVCTTRAIMGYLVEGKVPEDGSVCEVETKLWANVTAEELLAPLKTEIGLDVATADDAKGMGKGEGEKGSASSEEANSAGVVLQMPLGVLAGLVCVAIWMI